MTQLKVQLPVYASVTVRPSRGICNLRLSVSPGSVLLFCAGSFCECLSIETT